MLYVTKIRMLPGQLHSTRCEDIESMYLKGAHSETVHLKETVHAFLSAYPDTVMLESKDTLFRIEAATSPTGIHYVRSKNYQTETDPLFCLPKV